MIRIIQGLALAAVVSAAQAAPDDAYPSGGAPLFVTAQQTYASQHSAGAESGRAFPAADAPLFVKSKQTYADMHASEAKAQAVNPFPSQTAGSGD